MFTLSNWHDISEVMHDAIVVVAQDSLRIVYANRAFMDMTGFSLPALSRRVLPDLYAKTYRTGLDNLSILAEDDHVYFEAPLLTRESTSIPSETCVTAGQLDHHMCLLCVIRDNRHHLAVVQELRKIETLHRSLIEAMPDLLFRLRRDGTYLEFKLPDNLGLKIPARDDEIVGKKFADLLPPDVAEQATQALENVMQTGKMEAFKYSLEEPSGWHDYESRFVPSLEDEVIAVVRDITEQKQAENLLRIQRDLSVTLSVETDLNRALERVVEVAIQVTSMDVGGIYLTDPKSGALELKYSRGLSEKWVQMVSYFGPDTPQARLVMQGGTLYSNYDQIELPPEVLHQQENLRAFGIIPVLHGSEVIGCINISSHSLNDVPKGARAALETIASQIGSAIVRLRAEEARRESETTLRTLLNASQDLAMLLDINWTILAVNERAARYLRSSVEAMIGTNALAHIPPEIAQARKVWGEQVIETGEHVQFQDENRGLYFDNVMYPLFNTQHEVTRLAIFARDITKRKQDEESLRRKDQLLEGIAQATSRLMEVGDPETSFNQALALVGEHAGVDRTFIYESHLHPATNEPVISYRYGWSSAETPQNIDPTTVQNIPWQAYGLQDWYDMVAAGQDIRMNRQELLKIFPHIPMPFGTTSFLIMPIFNNTFWGIIGFGNRQTEREWPPEEINALRLMATSVGAAIERQQAEARLRYEREVADREREIADTLREVGMALTSTLERDKVLGRILEQARRVVPYDAANVFLLEDGVPRMVHSHGYEAFGLTEAYLSQIRLPLEEFPITKKIVQEGIPFLIPDIEADPEWHAFPGTDWIQSWLGVPIIVRGEVVGIFSFDSTQKNYYNEEHARLIVPFAQQAAIAFDNALLFENTQRLERVKSEMIRIASHDLRGPLTRIKESLRQLKEQLSDPPLTDLTLSDIPLIFARHQKYYALLEGATREMEQIAVNILSLERIESQHRAARAMAWCELLAGAVEIIRPDLEARQHRLSVECEPDLPLTRGDSVQLRRAMSNLISNAIKYTPPGGHIQVRLYKNSYGGKPTVAFEVRDNGIGIPQDIHGQLFDPFYRAEQAGTEDIPGLGLGLNIVKEAVKYHKGNVYVDSEPGKGSLFGFWVPAS